MKTVLFALNGSYSHTNLAVRAIGAHLADFGIQTVIIEKSLKDTRLSVLESLVREAADVYGFSVYIWNVNEMMQFASEVHALLPKAKIVFGGPEVSFENESFFESHPYIDHIITGEGEEAFPALCKALADGKEIPKIIMPMPYADFSESGIYYDRIGERPHGLVYYESVRGCPFSCAYCLSSVTEGIRAKTLEKTLDDLLRFEQFDGIRTVKLVDRTFNFNKERAKAIWRALSSDAYTKEYHFEVSAALLDAESFEILRNAPKGKFRLEIGVQSTNPDTVSAVDRRLDTEKTLNALKTLHEHHNLHLHADLIAGLPYEDFTRFGKSFDDIYGICDVLQLGFLKLLKGSKMRRDAEKYGIVYSPYPPYQVLKTNELSFSDITRLHAIDAMNDRFSNSGKFDHTFPYLPLASGSAFGFFDGLRDFAEEKFSCTEIARLPQTEAFRLIFAYAQTLANVNIEEVRERLALDFLLGETRRLPDFLHTHTVSAEEKRDVLTRVPANIRAGCEVVRFPWLAETPVIVDRVGRRMIK
ncbi:MAG: DUF4080 domain-containing protein [Clostridia bacterium]|nr:DUF4080 domain-containing protein [Clostridia bacterium]